MLYPGMKRGHVSNILIAIDQSGSVGDKAISMFFGELCSGLARQTTFDVVFFDTRVNEDTLFTWKRGSKVKPTRQLQGGTDFNAPTRYVNDQKGKYDGVLIMTDGECGPPEPCRVRRGYVIAPGCKLHFPTTDIVMNMSETKGGRVK